MGEAEKYVMSKKPRVHSASERKSRQTLKVFIGPYNSL
jgi:hypothetical protein